MPTMPTMTPYHQAAQALQRCSGTPNALSFATMSLEEATLPSSTSTAVIGNSQVVTFSSTIVDDLANPVVINSQTIQPCSNLPRGPFQTPPIMKRKRRPSTVTPPREQSKRDILWITEPPLFPSDLDLDSDFDLKCNDDDDENNSLSLPRPSFNLFRKINNRRTQEVCEDEETTGILPLGRRTPFTSLGFPNIPTLDEDSPQTPKPIKTPSSSLPTVSTWRKKKGPLKMRRLNSHS
jgi:hypothetical protein